MADLNSNTVDGLLAFCEYLVEKGYAPASQVEPWKTAVKKVFYTVEGEDYGPLNLDNLNMDDLVARFRVLANNQYKHESITAYGRRLQNAIDAHAYFRENNKPPPFRQVTKRSNGDEDASSRQAQPKASKQTKTARTPEAPQPTGPEFFDLSYPLESGHMASMRLPKRMSKNDVDRLSTVLRTLQGESQRQIEEHTGEDDAIAA